MTAYPIENDKLAWIMERLRDAMAEALLKQGLLTEAQRRELCAFLNCGGLRTFNRKQS